MCKNLQLNFVYLRKYLNDLVQNECSHMCETHIEHEIVLKLSHLDKIQIKLHIEIAGSMIYLKELLPAISGYDWNLWHTINLNKRTIVEDEHKQEKKHIN